eukprot:9302135-Pyramimonas_sp.AAC.1
MAVLILEQLLGGGASNGLGIHSTVLRRPAACSRRWNPAAALRHPTRRHGWRARGSRGVKLSLDGRHRGAVPAHGNVELPEA